MSDALSVGIGDLSAVPSVKLKATWSESFDPSSVDMSASPLHFQLKTNQRATLARFHATTCECRRSEWDKLAHEITCNLGEDDGEHKSSATTAAAATLKMPPKAPRSSKRRRVDSIIRSTKEASTQPPCATPPPPQQELWTEKYQFKNEDEIVSNHAQLERLKEWLSSWKAVLSRDNRHGNDTGDESGSESEFASDSECSTVNNGGRKFYTNAILLSGPHGSGKTSSIYSVAKQLNFKVHTTNNNSPLSKK